MQKEMLGRMKGFPCCSYTGQDVVMSPGESTLLTLQCLFASVKNMISGWAGIATQKALFVNLNSLTG